jgi:hypothetical protein
MLKQIIELCAIASRNDKNDDNESSFAVRDSYFSDFILNNNKTNT